jgi:hypothetical protein
MSLKARHPLFFCRSSEYSKGIKPNITILHIAMNLIKPISGRNIYQFFYKTKIYYFYNS